MPAAKKVTSQRTKPAIFAHTLGVVGLGFRMKQDVRRALAANVAHTVAGLEGIKLVREQENKYDVNAIAVYHPQRGALAGKHLGYLRADTAAKLAPLMDDGKDGGFVFKSAKLTALDDGDNFKSGWLEVEFWDYRKR